MQEHDLVPDQIFKNTENNFDFLGHVLKKKAPKSCQLDRCNWHVVVIEDAYQDLKRLGLKREITTTCSVDIIKKALGIIRVQMLTLKAR